MRGVRVSEREQAGRDPWPNRAGGHPKTCPNKCWAPQKLAPQVVGTPKHTPQSPLPPTSILLPSLPLIPWASLGFPGPLEFSWGLRKTWEPLQAFSSLGSSVRLRDLASLAPPHPLSLPLTPSHPLSLPRSLWVPGTFLGTQKALGALTSLQQPLAALGLQSDSGTLLPLLPLTPSRSLSPPLAPWASLDLPGYLGPSWGLGKPWEPSQAFGRLWQPLGLQSDSEALLPLLPLTPSCFLSLPLTPSCFLSLPRPPWVPGTFLGPWEALGAFTSLRQPLAALGLQSDSGALLPLIPLTPLTPLSLSLVPWVFLDLPGPLGTFLGPEEALGAFRSFWQPWVFSQTQGPCFPCSPLPPSLPLTSSCLLSPTKPPWASLSPWDLSEASGSLGSL